MDDIIQTSVHSERVYTMRLSASAASETGLEMGHSSLNISYSG